MSRYLKDMTMPFARQRRTVLTDDGAYQVDMVVAFFAVLLVLFVVYSAHAYSRVAERSLTKYRTADRHLVPFRLRSFAPLYPYRDFWIIKDDAIFKLDTVAVARMYMETKGIERIWHVDGVRIETKVQENSPAEYEIWIQIQNNVPTKIMKMSLKMERGEKNMRDLMRYFKRIYMKQHHPFFFFIWRNMGHKVQPFLKRLTDTGIPYGVSFVDYEFAITRKSKNYGEKNALRPY